MSNVAYLPIEADRYGACVRQIYIRGLDLTGIAMRAQVRLAGDTPGAPLVDLQTVTNGNAEGLRLVSVETVDGLPISHVELVINETTMEGLPYAGELGSATELLWDCQLVLAGRKQRIARGEFTITGDGVTGADYAPANRPQAWSRSFSSTSGMRAGASLTFGDEISEVTIDGANLVAAQVDRATNAQDRAEAAQGRADLSAGAAQGAARYFTSRAAGEAASIANQAFATDDGAGNVIYYRRTSGGSTEIGRAVTPAGLSASDGSSRVGFKSAQPTAVARTALAKARDLVSAKDFGAKGDGVTDDTAAIQAMLDSGVTDAFFPWGQYLHRALQITTAYQRLWGAGAQLIRADPNATIAVKARGVHFNDLRIGCQTTGMAGHNVTVTAPDFRHKDTENIGCLGRPYLFLNCGGGIILNGGKVQTPCRSAAASSG